MFFQQKLIFQIFQFLHFLQNTVLIINQIQVMYDLFLYFNQIMIRIIQLQFHVAHHIPHLYIHRHPEKSRLSVVYQFFALANQQGDIIPFLVQPKKFGLFDPVIRFILVGVVHVPFQVHHIADGGKGDVLQAAFHFPLIVVFTLFSFK